MSRFWRNKCTRRVDPPRRWHIHVTNDIAMPAAPRATTHSRNGSAVLHINCTVARTRVRRTRLWWIPFTYRSIHFGTFSVKWSERRGRSGTLSKGGKGEKYKAKKERGRRAAEGDTPIAPKRTLCKTGYTGALWLKVQHLAYERIFFFLGSVSVRRQFGVPEDREGRWVPFYEWDTSRVLQKVALIFEDISFAS